MDAQEVLASIMEACDGADYDRVAQAQLDALKAVGHAVVKLPEPCRSTSDTDQWEWTDGAELRAVWRVGDEVCHSFRRFTPDETRVLAAALLAAASAAEKAGQ